jgi:hypothetical protein
VVDTDWFGLCKTGTMDLLKAITDLFPNPAQVTENDAVLSQGKGNYYAIFRTEAFPFTRASGTQSDVTWIITFDFYVRYKTYAEFPAKFEAARSKIFNKLHPQALVSVKNVQRATLSAVGGFIADMQSDNPNFVGQTFNYAVLQRVPFM